MYYTYYRSLTRRVFFPLKRHVNATGAEMDCDCNIKSPNACKKCERYFDYFLKSDPTNKENAKPRFSDGLEPAKEKIVLQSNGQGGFFTYNA